MVIINAAVLSGTMCALCILQWDFKANQNSVALTVKRPKEVVISVHAGLTTTSEAQPASVLLSILSES